MGCICESPAGCVGPKAGHRCQWVVRRADFVPRFFNHSRRTDFKNFKGLDFTSLASYAASVETVRDKLAFKLRSQSRWNKPRDRPYLQAFATPPSEYKVLVATDEEDEKFRREVEGLGWVVINHVRCVPDVSCIHVDYD